MHVAGIGLTVQTRCGQRWIDEMARTCKQDVADESSAMTMAVMRPHRTMVLDALGNHILVDGHSAT